MKGYIQTQRTATNVETGEKFSVHTHTDTHKWILVGDNKTIENGFYMAGYDIAIKLNNGKVIQLKQGDFYQFNEGEKVTHIKGVFHKRFVKA